MLTPIDLQEINRKLDTLDATGPTSRDLQQLWLLSQVGLALVGKIRTGVNGVAGAVNAGSYTLSEDWVEADRAAYETALNTAATALSTAFAQAKVLLKQ